MDVSGELHLDVEHDVYKQRLSPSGVPVSQAERHVLAPPSTAPLPGAAGANHTAATATAACGTCYGAEDADHPCCNTCDEVRAAYQRKGWVMLKLTDVTQCAHDGYLEAVKQQEGEGCRMWGRLEVNKVAGNFHFAAGRSFQQGSVHIHDMAPFADKPLDFTHTVKRLSFGPQYPGMTNPLDGAASSQFGAESKQRGSGGGGGGKMGGEKQTQAAGSAGGKGAGGKTGMYQYFLKVRLLAWFCCCWGGCCCL